MRNKCEIDAKLNAKCENKCETHMSWAQSPVQHMFWAQSPVQHVFWAQSPVQTGWVNLETLKGEEKGPWGRMGMTTKGKLIDIHIRIELKYLVLGLIFDMTPIYDSGFPNFRNSKF